MSDSASLDALLELGLDDHDQRVQIPLSSLMLGTYIAGLQGNGKTNLLKIIFRQAARAGAGALLIDPAGDVSREMLSAWPDELVDRLVYLDASDPTHAFGLNLFQVDEDSALGRQVMVDDVLEIFQRIFEAGETSGWGWLIETTLRGTAQVFADHPGMTITEILPFLYDEDFRAQLVAGATTFPDTVDSWERFDELRPGKRNEIVASTERKVLRLATNQLIRHIVGQSRSTINFRQLMDERKLVLVRLPKGPNGLSEEGRILISTLIVSSLFKAALSRFDTTDRPPFVIIVDEFQTLVLREFPEMISQARKFNVGVVLANQYLGQLEKSGLRDSVMTAVNRVAFQLASRDAQLMGREDYFRAIPKPIEPVRKVKITPIYDTRSEEYWDPPMAFIELVTAQEADYRGRGLAGLLEAGGKDVPLRGRSREDLLADERVHQLMEYWVEPRKSRLVEQIDERTFRFRYLPKSYDQLDRRVMFSNQFGLNLRGHDSFQGTRQQFWNALSEAVGDRFHEPHTYVARWAGGIEGLFDGPYKKRNGYTGVMHEYEWPTWSRWVSVNRYDDLVHWLANYVEQCPTDEDIQDLREQIERLQRCKKTRVIRTETGFEQVVKHVNPYSGKEEPVYEWVDGDLQSPTAAKADLAQTLAHLPKHETLMRLELAGGAIWQGKVWPHFAKEHEPSEQRAAWLRDLSRRQYYRPRSAVEAEIATRKHLAPRPPVIYEDDAGDDDWGTLRIR